jgi:hypothetical protein
VALERECQLERQRLDALYSPPHTVLSQRQCQRLQAFFYTALFYRLSSTHSLQPPTRSLQPPTRSLAPLSDGGTLVWHAVPAVTVWQAVSAVTVWHAVTAQHSVWFVRAECEGRVSLFRERFGDC